MRNARLNLDLKCQIPISDFVGLFAATKHGRWECPQSMAFVLLRVLCGYRVSSRRGWPVE